MQKLSKDGRTSVDRDERQGMQLNGIPSLVVHENSSAAIRCQVPWSETPPAKAELKESPRQAKSLLWLALPTVAVLSWLLIVGHFAPQGVAGLGLRELAVVMAIIFFSGVMSGLSGFGFSAIGAASLLLLPPVLQVPLFQALSTGNQFLSIGQLREEMPKTLKELRAGPGPCLMGGLVGVPIGIWLLFHLPAARLMALFGALLTSYAFYSLVKPASLKLRGCDGCWWATGVGFVGGVVGGFTAFPGAAVVVWTGLRGLPKAQSRAIVQPYIILSQIYSLALVALLHPTYLNARFWLLLALSLPVVVPGTLTGLAIYRRTSDINFRRISFVLLGISGISLLAKTCGPWIRALF
jgi:uncharacterized membrane protein YfcA